MAARAERPFGAGRRAREHSNTAHPEIFSGKPIIRGLRISVETVLNPLVQGETADELLDDYPGLGREDILACLAYARALGTSTAGGVAR